MWLRFFLFLFYMVFPISVASHHHSYLQSNRNGFGSSILSWLGGFGHRNFEGYRIHSEKTVDIQDFPEACQSALTAVVRCDDYTADWTSPSYHGILPKEVDVESVCDKGCAQAISKWRSDVETYCGDLTWRNGAAAGVLGSFISQGINETCQTDKTGKYCNGKQFHHPDLSASILIYFQISSINLPFLRLLIRCPMTNSAPIVTSVGSG